VDKEDAVEPVREEEESKVEFKEDDRSESLNRKENGIAMSPSLEKKSINLSTNLGNIENPSESILIPASPKETPKQKDKKVLESHTPEEDNTEMISTQVLGQTNADAKEQLTPYRKSSKLFQKGKY